MSNWKQFESELRKMVEASVASLEAGYKEETRPRLRAILEDVAIITARKAAGDNTRLVEAALEASLANLALQEQLRVQSEANDLVLKTALKVAGIVASAL